MIASITSLATTVESLKSNQADRYTSCNLKGAKVVTNLAIHPCPRIPRLPNGIGEK